MYRNFKIKFMFFTYFLVVFVCLASFVNLNIYAVPSSSANSSSSKSNSTNSNLKSSKSSSKNKNKSSDSLLPDTGESVAPATSQDWDDILSALEEDKNDDEFTFSEQPNSGIFANKLALMGFGLVTVSVLGFTCFFYSQFLSKKSPAKLAKQFAYIDNNFNNPTNRKTTSSDIRTRKPNAQSLYFDGYGHTKKNNIQNKKATPQKAHEPSLTGDKNHQILGQASFSANKMLDNREKINTKTAKHMIEDDDIFSFSDKNKINNSVARNANNEGKKHSTTKRDEFWNDFFSK